MKIKQIGIIHSPYKTMEETPIQPFKTEAMGRVEVFKEYKGEFKKVYGKITGQ